MIAPVPSEFITPLFQGMILMILTTVFAIFSPLGIGFIIFSVIRHKTLNSSLKKVSVFFQVFLSIATLIIGVVIAILFFFTRNYGFYYIYGASWIGGLAVLMGIGFVFVIELGVIIWQSSSSK